MAPINTTNVRKTAAYADYLPNILQKGMLQGSLPVVTTNPNRLEAEAEKVMRKAGFDYIRGGAGEAATMDSNRLAFRQWKIIPRVLIPTTPRDLSVTLFGCRYGTAAHFHTITLSVRARIHMLTLFFSEETPVIMAPIGVQSLYHIDKEIGTARACAKLSVPFTLSTASSTGIEELALASPQGQKWFQLYWPLDEELTASILTRAKTNGFQVLVVTLDTWTLAWRPYDLDPASLPFFSGEGTEVGFQDPVFRKKFASQAAGALPEERKMEAAAYWCGEVFSGASRSWEDLKILRRLWDGPIVLKGVLSVEDAILAVEHGMDGIIVSNHGGRQLDGAVASLEMLPDIANAVGDKITVMLDSGIRTGADMFKALALGARAVFVGRPIVYGLGISGEAGAEAVLSGLLADLDLTMGFSGVQKVSDLDRRFLRRVAYGADAATSA